MQTSQTGTVGLCSGGCLSKIQLNRETKHHSDTGKTTEVCRETRSSVKQRNTSCAEGFCQSSSFSLRKAKR